jgi:mutual gliding-motility protein MglA
MVLFNYSTKEITAKIVFYGPGLCGKTTNLQFIYDNMPKNIQRGRMLSLATKTDRTLFFDFLPIDLGTIRDMRTRVQLYTVPGQVFYNSTRKLVLKGADGIVFVADSQKKMEDANVESFRNLEENCLENGIDLTDTPLVLQFNKRDLPEVSSLEDLNASLNKYNAPFYESVATTGIGVHETLKGVTKLVLHSLQEQFASERDKAARPPLGASAPAALAPSPAGEFSLGAGETTPPMPPAEPVAPPMGTMPTAPPAVSPSALTPPMGGMSAPGSGPSLPSLGAPVTNETIPIGSVTSWDLPVPPAAEEPIVLDDPADPISKPSPGPPPQETMGEGTDFASVGPPVEVGPMPSEPSSLPVIEGLLRRGEASEMDGQETTDSRMLSQPTTESFDDLREEFEGSQALEIPGPSSSEVGARLGSRSDDSPAPQIPGRDMPQMSSAEPTVPTSANLLEEDPLGLGFPQTQPAATVSPVLIQPGQEELNIPLEVRTGDRVLRYRLRLQISLGQED